MTMAMTTTMMKKGLKIPVYLDGSRGQILFCVNVEFEQQEENSSLAHHAVAAEGGVDSQQIWIQRSIAFIGKYEVTTFIA